MRELYLVFQHHTTHERSRLDCDMFGSEYSYSTLTLIDDGAVAILGLDTRAERTATQIVR
jgi:hypothetical protein